MNRSEPERPCTGWYEGPFAIFTKAIFVYYCSYMSQEEMQQTEKGHVHPITLALYDIAAYFTEQGFEIAEGPEIETEHYNFDALNVPKDHPARDMWDTFWVQPRSAGKLLRTHTSPVQVRFMEKHKPPFRIIVPGKTYRYEATDATHETQFYQLEGLVVEDSVSLAHLKGTLDGFLDYFFGKDIDIRFRPSYFPFVEPGVEVDMSCFRCGGKEGCPLCKGTGWIEIMGAGMVHPNVFASAGLSRDLTGFAFGVGIDRLVMLRHEIDDIRLFYNGDARLVFQF